MSAVYLSFSCLLTSGQKTPRDWGLFWWGELFFQRSFLTQSWWLLLDQCQNFDLPSHVCESWTTGLVARNDAEDQDHTKEPYKDVARTSTYA